MSRKENGDLAGQLFGIRHYAGEVSYHAATMVAQNVDCLFSDVVHLLSASDSPFIRNLFSDDPETEEINFEKDILKNNQGQESDDDGDVIEPEVESEEEEDEAAIAARRAKAVARRKGGGGNDTESTPPPSSSSSSSSVQSTSGGSSLRRSMSSSQGGAAGNQSICNQMMTGMNELLSLLEEGNPHYIRCIKTNDHKKKQNVDLELIQEQVRYLGIRENVLVRRVGFCFYQPYEEFVNRYRIISRLTWPPKPSIENEPPSSTAMEASDENEGTIISKPSISYGKGKKGWRKWACVGILSHGEPSEWVSKFGEIPPIYLTEGEDYRLGKDKVFIRQPSSLQLLEDARQLTLGHVACIIQSFIRKLVYVKKFKLMKQSVILITSLHRKRMAVIKYKKSLAFLVSVQVKVRRFISKIKVKQLRRQFHNKPPRYWANKQQAWYRSVKCRLSLPLDIRMKALKCGNAAMQFSPKRMKASNLIQTLYRKYHALKSYKIMLKQFKRIPPRIYALKLQSRYRRYKIRSQIDENLLKKYNSHMSYILFHTKLRKKAGILIQSKARSVITRKKTNKMKAALL